MEHVGSNPSTITRLTGYQQAWEMVTSQLRMEMNSGLYDTWVKPVQPLGYSDQVFTIGVHNTYSQEWVEQRLSPRISRLLAGLYNEKVELKIKVTNGFYREGAPHPAADTIEPIEKTLNLLNGSSRMISKWRKRSRSNGGKVQPRPSAR
jgi:chromosomal replication initiation ATPase DnaA